MAPTDPQHAGPLQALPDFCRGESLALLALAMQLVAICLTLAGSEGGASLLPRLVLLSLYLHWIGLCGAAVLCALRQRLAGLSARLSFSLAWLALVTVVMLLAALAWSLDNARGLQLIEPHDAPLVWLLRNACLSAIVALVLLRYFWIQQQWRKQLQAEADARFQTLTARIRPHFLFNALNSLAELIASRPEQAEHLVEDLADVLRASISEPGRLVPLCAELDACGAYLRIEQLRLGERLRLDWQVPDDLLDCRVPRFVLQPLVENAVYHGVSRVAAGGTLSLRAQRSGATLRIEVYNPRTDEPSPAGQGIAQGNIQHRLALIYGDRARLLLQPSAGGYSAVLELPQDG